jgi:hypothetical protein
MNISEMLGAPVQDVAEFDRPTRSACSIPVLPDDGPVETSGTSRWAWTLLGLVAALAVGFGVGTYLAPEPVTAEQMAPVSVTASSLPPANIGSFAELVTALQITGLADPADLARLYPGNPPSTEPTGLWVNRAAAVATTSLGDELWRVTVAVDALEFVDDASESLGGLYSVFTVAGDGGRPVAVSAPSRIPAPAATTSPTGIPGYGEAVPADEATAVASFIEAYLTGRGEVARFVATTARIPIFAEPPYDSVEIGAIGADSLGNVRASVVAITAHGGRQPLEYTLEMTFETGVWEVSNLVAAASSTP